MRDVFNILPKLTVSTSAMIIMIIAVRAVFAHKLSSKMIACLWLLVIMRLLIPYTIESPLHIDALFPTDKANVQAAMELSAEPDASPEKAINIYPYALPEESPVASPGAQAKEITAFERLKSYARNVPIKDFAFAIWLAGIVFMVVWQATLAIGFFRKTGYSKCNNDAYLEAQSEELCKERRIIPCHQDIAYLLSIPAD